jgi:ribulose-phosphate 3-epimerase
MPLIDTLLDEVRALHAAAPQCIPVVGIDGPTAAGKTILADNFAEALRASGFEAWVFRLDWTLKERIAREADVEHLRDLGLAFRFEGELHMRLEVAQQALERVAAFNRRAAHGHDEPQTIWLSKLYSRSHGGTATGEEQLHLRRDMVVLVEGHYTLRSELDALIDYNLVLLSEPQELLARKVERVKGYRTPDNAIHYFWHTDLPSFRHHLTRFGGNADLIIDNTNYRDPQVITRGDLLQWLSGSSQETPSARSPLAEASDIPEHVLSASRMVPPMLGDILEAAVDVVIQWDRVVGQYLRVAVDEVEEDLETAATRACEELNHQFCHSLHRARVSHTDSLYHVYHRQLPLALGIELYDANSGATVMAVLAEVERDRLRIGMYWDGGATWVSFERALGGIGDSRRLLRADDHEAEAAPEPAGLRVFLPTEFAIPSFLTGVEFDPVFIGREQENVSASRVLGSILCRGGVWIHRFAFHREIRFFEYCLRVEGAQSVQVGNYLIAVKSSDPQLRRRFRAFRQQWATPSDRLIAAQAGRAHYDAVLEQEKADVRSYVADKCRHLRIMDGALFGNVFGAEAAHDLMSELAALLQAPQRILRKRAIEFISDSFPGFTLPTAALWTELPHGARTSLSLGEFTSLSSSIMAEIYLWLALRNENAAVLGANVYDIRSSSLDARAHLEAAAERGCPVVLQCSLNALGQLEADGESTFHGYLKPADGVVDFVRAARRAARDLYLVSGKRAPLYGIGLDHINEANDRPAGRARRFLQHAIATGGVTHVVLDGSDLFELKTSDRSELLEVYQRMNRWVFDLMTSPHDTFLKDMEICISELNYVGTDSVAYVPTTEDIRLFARTYNDALVERGFACHVARPKLFISNLGTRHHSADDVRPWVEKSQEWRDAVKSDGFVSAVLHGTSRSHQDTLSASTVGCHKVNVAGDFLDTIVENLPMALSRRVQESPELPKKVLPELRPDMDRFTEAESAKVYSAVREHSSRLLKTIASPQLTSMDVNYFQYKDFDFTPLQVEAILDEVRRERGKLLPKAPRRVADSRQGVEFSASMIEVPYEMFKGPILDALWDEGIRYFHVDAGDGVFVPRAFSGVDKVRYLRKHFPAAVIHCHLMVVNPHYPKDGEFAEIQQYAEAGADGVAIHLRSCASRAEAVSALKIIRRLNMRPGIVIETSDAVDEHLEALIRDQSLDWVVVMGVPIGYGGQVFQHSTLSRISRLHDLAGRLSRDFLVECDGGLTMQNLELCRNAGGQLFSGWSIVKGRTIEDMREKVRAVQRTLSGSA